VLVVLLAGLLLLSIDDEASACIRDVCFEVELAQTPHERQEGLMYRETLDADGGMLFMFEDEGVYAFWMKHTLIPLDIIWIDANYTIVHIANDVQPCVADPCPSVYPDAAAQYVLEINEGLAENYGFSVGDEVTFSFAD